MEVVQTSWTNAVFAGTYTDARSQLQEFNQYKSGTKRSWVLERTDLSALLGNIQTKLKTYHLKEWLPRKGLRQKDLDEFWILHASKEADRARSINNEIRKVKEELRKRFANLANEFEKKLLKINTEISKLSGDLENQRSKVKSLQESSLSDLVGAYVERRNIPTPAQVFDFVSRSIVYRKYTETPLEGTSFHDWDRAYTDQDAINLSIETFVHNKYLDVHCTVWTPESFVNIFRKVNDLGLMNIDVSEPILIGRDEFVVFLTKKGPPILSQPAANNKDQEAIAELTKRVEHAERAFHECNDSFRIYMEQHPHDPPVEEKRSFWRRLFGR